MITKHQIQRLKDTGKVADVEDEGMDDEDGRFFVHLTNEFTWNDGYGIQRTKSFGGFADAARAVKHQATRG